MKISLIGLCVAGAAAILLQTGLTTLGSSALAAEGCIVTDVAVHVKRCPAGAKLETHSGGIAPVVETAEPTVTPTVTPTAGPPEGCIKTDVALHVRRCPVGV